MKLRRNRMFGAEVATSALNDIMFFLLLFFLIVATVANPNVIKLMLPKASTAQSVQTKQITLSIDKEKHFYLDKNPVDFSNLESEILKASKGIQDPAIIIRADNSLTVQDLVDILSIGVKLKIKMVLATERQQ